MRTEKVLLTGKLAGALMLIFFIYWYRSVLAQIAGVLLLAFVFSLFLVPLCRLLERKGASCAMASAISIGMLLSAALVLGFITVPCLITNTVSLIKNIMPGILSFESWLSAFLAQRGIELSGGGKVAEQLAAGITAFTARAWNTGVVLVRHLGFIAFSLAIAYYFLKERSLWTRRCLLLFPLKVRGICLSAVQASKNALLGYAASVLKTGLFVAVATFLGLKVLGVKNAFLLAALMGVLEIFPYIGPILASVPILLVAMPRGIHHSIACLLVIILIQQLESNVIGPYLTASSVSIHPLTALVGVFAFGCFFGFWGILIAVPVIVVFRSLYATVRQAI